eukprot:CAMPEP_0117463834 /NCGR_PEP_ID=MMETSP0784-20121206/3786_1 /TAXON_ID=39447 /ORGANISM="" /LENGTH=109 /DNA_ID=CAMNT_0005257667 /DNA_START=263 /DNA_END=592 /DNA_ORIENTATION=+
MGQGACKKCNETSVLYNLSWGGALDFADCRRAKCRCAAGDTQCEETQCATSSAIESAMTDSPRDTAFCAKIGVLHGSCSWAKKSAARFRSAGIWRVALLLASTMLVLSR